MVGLKLPAVVVSVPATLAEIEAMARRIRSWRLGTLFLGNLVQEGWQRLLLLAGVTLGAVFLSLFLTALSVAPFRRAFVAQEGRTRHSFVGKVCTITTQRVDAGFGMAEIQDAGSSLKVPVRCLKANNLKKDSKALIFGYDAKEEVFRVVPHDDA